MNIHKNARLTFVRRVEMVQDVLQSRIPAEQAATHYGVSPPTVRKWVGRYLAEGQDGLRDRSSRPAVSPRSIDANKALTIIELRKKRMTQARIAEYMGVSKATVSRILKLAGMSQMRDLEPAPIIQRYEHAHPGDLLHFDTKKLGRIEKMGHRVTGDRSGPINAGWEVLYVAIDDHARVAFTEIHPDETSRSSEQFLMNAFRNRCANLGIKHRRTRPYRPQTNGKAERFIQSALREWAYGFAYHHSNERAAILDEWQDHYNWHRPHQGIGGQAPMSRLRFSRKNLLQLHT